MGNKCTSASRLKKYIRTKPGEFINEDTMIGDLYFINQNPFRTADLVYTPGEMAGTTDVDILVNDRCPFRLFSGAENTGVDTVGRNRWFVGFNWGNAFGLDQILSYQFTGAFHLDKFNAHTVQYTAPLPWRHILSLFGGYSKVHADLPHDLQKDHDNTGYSIQASLRYNIPMTPKLGFLNGFNLGFDFKRTNNTLEYVEEDEFPVLNGNVNLTQLVLGYGCTYEKSRIKAGMNVEVFCSPGEWLSDQTNDDFQNLRYKAKNTYIYGKADLSTIFTLPKDYAISLLLRGQVSDTNLLPSEQMGVGGYNTVRGYEERELNGDHAIIGNLELRFPAFHPLKYLNNSKAQESLHFLLFFDGGAAFLHKPMHGEKRTDYLLGVGPGLRYVIEPYLTLRLDWGMKLHKEKRFEGGDSMWHFGLVVSY